MDNKGQVGSNSIKIQGILDRYLQVNSSGVAAEPGVVHLDEDSLNAFIEGTLSEREALSMVSHLNECSYCRHVSAELIKLSCEFAEDPVPVVNAETEPSRVSEVLGSVLSNIFGMNDGAVFAHNEDDEEKSDENTGTD